MPEAVRTRLDFSAGVVGKYYDAAIQSRRTILLDADLLETFPDADAVNTALRSLQQSVPATRKPLNAKRLKAKAA